MTPAPEPNDDDTGLPVFRTWRSVYCFVLVCFLADVALLAAFTHFYS